MTAEGRGTGVIAAILSIKRYGFIHPDGQKVDLFFHSTAVRDEGGFNCLQPGMRVSYVVIEGELGLKAVGVERIEE